MKGLAQAKSSTGVHALADLLDEVQSIGEAAEPHAARHDREASFVTEGYAAVRAARYGAAAIPRELGGRGHDLSDICHAQARLAGYCANTALAIAMHQHTVLTLAWRWRLGDRVVEPILKRLAAEDLILSSSGASDHANPGVSATPTDGGVIVNGRKRLCSGSPGADLIATLALLVEGGKPSRTLTVFVPTADPGTTVIPEWDSMGMRGSGSNPVAFSDVFLPEANVINLGQLPVASRVWRQRRRRAGDYADPSSVGGEAASVRIPGLQIALPVITSVYLGAADAIARRAIQMTSGAGPVAPDKLRLAGLIAQELRSAWWAMEAMLADATDDTIGSEEQFVTTMLAKRQAVLSSIKVVELSAELLGTRSYMRAQPFEQALRDVRAGITHPLPPERTLFEVGRSVLDDLDLL